VVAELAETVELRRAVMSDATAIARVLRRSLDSLGWMPKLHTAKEDLAFIRQVVLPNQIVTVAEAEREIVGFIAVHDTWIDLLYIDPAWTGRGVGSRLLAKADLAEAKLYCFQANLGARRFYERHGFRAAALSGGARNEEGLPDILYVRRR
jgi:ribosomal protein S18 acetylase RimI-like enzyme